MPNHKVRAYCLGCRERVGVEASSLERVRWGPVIEVRRWGRVTGRVRWALCRAGCPKCGGRLSMVRQEGVCPPHHFLISQDGQTGQCRWCGETRDYSKVKENARCQIAERAKKRGIGLEGDIFV